MNNLMLRLVNMDVTKEDHVKHAMNYVADNLPAGELGKSGRYLRLSEMRR